MKILLYGSPVLLYALAWWQALGSREQAARPVRAMILVALLLHGVALVLPVAQPEPNFGFAHVLSAALWLAVGILWLESLTARLDALWFLVLPAAVAVAWLPALYPGAPLAPPLAPLFVPHLLLGVGAYSFMTLAALQSILMALAERALHDPARLSVAGVDAGAPTATPWSRWIDRLPPLMTLERLLFRLIGAGFVFLSLTVLTGVVFSELAFGRPFRLDHKTVFTLLAWSLFATLLIGRRLQGWRGATALRFTLGGFVLLMLAYAGSRFVFEVVLGRVPGA